MYPVLYYGINLYHTLSEDNIVSINLHDVDNHSRLRVNGHDNDEVTEFLSVEYFEDSKDMIITIDGKFFSNYKYVFTNAQIVFITSRYILIIN